MASCVFKEECVPDDSPVVEEVVGKLADVPPGTKKTFEVRGRKMLVINDDGKLFAINGVCSHYNFSLENGVYAKGRIRCPLHGACFNVRTGDIEDYPGFDSLNAFQVREENGDIIIKTTEKSISSDRRTRFFLKIKESDDVPIVVIGSGPAAGTFIEHSRLNGVRTPIVVVSEESFPPYDRVLLSKKPTSKGDEIRMRKDEYYENANVTFQLATSVTSLKPHRRQIILSNDSTLQYSKLVIATGGNVRKLTVPGSDLKNVFYLRKVQEANEIAEKSTGKHVVCIGASFIGMEMASSLAASAASVTVISNTDEPLPVFGPDIGRGIRTKFEEKGVRFERGVAVTSLTGSDGQVEKVVLNNGHEVNAEIVLVGIGVTPATEFLNGSGIQLDNAGFILVDSLFRTNVDYIYAIGDVTSFPLPLWNIEHTNIQHFQTAQMHGHLLGYSIAGKPQPGPIVPYFWTLFFSQFGIKFAGVSKGTDSYVTHGNPEAGTFVRYFLKNDIVVAVCAGGPGTVPAQFAELFKKKVVVKKGDVEANTSGEWAQLLPM